MTTKRAIAWTLATGVVVALGTAPATANSPNDSASEHERRCLEQGAVDACTLAAQLLEDDEASRATELLARACGKGVANCPLVSRAIAAEEVGRADRAGALLKKACELDNAKGCAILAFWQEIGRTVPRDVRSAAALSEKACRLGHESACLHAARAYEAGEEVAKNGARAAELRKKHAELLRSTVEAIRKSNDAHAASLAALAAEYKKTCEKQLDVSCVSLASTVDPGELPRLIPLFERACTKDACALGVAGYRMMRELGRPASVFFELTEKACARDDAASCSDLATQYVYGHIVARDRARGAQFAAKGCALGDLTACRVVVALRDNEPAAASAVSVARERIRASEEKARAEQRKVLQATLSAADARKAAADDQRRREEEAQRLAPLREHHEQLERELAAVLARSAARLERHNERIRLVSERRYDEADALRMPPAEPDPERDERRKLILDLARDLGVAD